MIELKYLIKNQNEVFSDNTNFGSKILEVVKKAAQLFASALYKVLSTISGPVGMIHPAIGGTLGVGAKLAGMLIDWQINAMHLCPANQRFVDIIYFTKMDSIFSLQQLRTIRQLITSDVAYYFQYQKRGNSNGGMMTNEEYQLFIDNNNALVYATNNQIIDGMASDFTLKIEPYGLQTIKNLKVINFDSVAQIIQLINYVNLLQQSIGATKYDITNIKNVIDTINQELLCCSHFRGNYLLNSEIQSLFNSDNGDLAFSFESGTV